VTHPEDVCENPLCWHCNPEERPRCGPCRKVMELRGEPGAQAFVCPSCGAGVTMAGRLR
jgi:hypothetical protein